MGAYAGPPVPAALALCPLSPFHQHRKAVYFSAEIGAGRGVCQFANGSIRDDEQGRQEVSIFFKKASSFLVCKDRYPGLKGIANELILSPEFKGLVYFIADFPQSLPSLFQRRVAKPGINLRKG